MKSDFGIDTRPIELGDSDSLRYGDPVYAIGNASNFGLSFTQGIVSMPRVVVAYGNTERTMIQVDLTISAGNSGGALLDERGRLVGITTFRTKDNAGSVIYGLAYCIPIRVAIEFFRICLLGEP